MAATSMLQEAESLKGKAGAGGWKL